MKKLIIRGALLTVLLVSTTVYALSTESTEIPSQMQITTTTSAVGCQNRNCNQGSCPYSENGSCPRAEGRTCGCGCRNR